MNIEKIAKAIFDSRNYKTQWRMLNPGMKGEYMGLARAALKEILAQQEEKKV